MNTKVLDLNGAVVEIVTSSVPPPDSTTQKSSTREYTGGLESKIEAAAEKFDQALAKVCGGLADSLKQAAEAAKVSEFALKFTLSFNTKGGFVIGEFGSASSFEVSMKWSN